MFINCTTTTKVCVDPFSYFLCKVVELSKLYDWSILDTIDRIQDLGFTTNSCDFCCNDCEYILASVETYKVYVLAKDIHLQNETNCCVNIFASVERLLTYAEAVGINQVGSSSAFPLKMPIQGDDAHDNSVSSCDSNLSCCNDFNKCILDIGCNNQCFNADTIGLLLDKGIVENLAPNQQTKICELIEFFRITKVDLNECIATILDRVTDKGIVIRCYNGKVFISGVETSLVEQGLIQ
jgi:hypothetical protein